MMKCNQAHSSFLSVCPDGSSASMLTLPTTYFKRIDHFTYHSILAGISKRLVPYDGSEQADFKDSLEYEVSWCGEFIILLPSGSGRIIAYQPDFCLRKEGGGSRGGK